MNRRRLLGFIGVGPDAGADRALGAGFSKKPFTPEQLDQLLAPIALYPDAPAVADPDGRDLSPGGGRGGALDAGQSQPQGRRRRAGGQGPRSWDVSVKSLVAFPQTLAMMNNNLDWTQKIGDAMIGQQKDVADSIQRLRAKAAAAGNLKTTPQQKVTTQTTGCSQRHRHRAGQSRNDLRAVLQSDLGLRAVALSGLSAGLLSAAAQLRRGAGDRHDVRRWASRPGRPCSAAGTGAGAAAAGAPATPRSTSTARPTISANNFDANRYRRRPVAARSRRIATACPIAAGRARALQPGAAGRPAARPVPRPDARAATQAANARAGAAPVRIVSRGRRERPEAPRQRESLERLRRRRSRRAGQSRLRSRPLRRGAIAASTVAAAVSSAAAEGCRR